MREVVFVHGSFVGKVVEGRACGWLVVSIFGLGADREAFFETVLFIAYFNPASEPAKQPGIFADDVTDVASFW